MVQGRALVSAPPDPPRTPSSLSLPTTRISRSLRRSCSRATSRSSSGGRSIPYDRATWWAENIPIVAVVTALVVLYVRGVRFSPLAYVLMAVLPYWHTVGGHYTFERVPFDWFDRAFGFQRNMYDRVGHFSVGFFAFGILEYLLRRRDDEPSRSPAVRRLRDRVRRDVLRAPRVGATRRTAATPRPARTSSAARATCGMPRRTCSWTRSARSLS